MPAVTGIRWLGSSLSLFCRARFQKKAAVPLLVLESDREPSSFITGSSASHHLLEIFKTHLDKVLYNLL